MKVAKVNYYLARLLITQARYSQAEVLLKRALNVYVTQKAADDLEVAMVLNRFVLLLLLLLLLLMMMMILLLCIYIIV